MRKNFVLEIKIIIIGIIGISLLSEYHLENLFHKKKIYILLEKLLAIVYIGLVLSITVFRKESFTTPQRILVPFQSYLMLAKVPWHGFGMYVAMAILGNLVLFIPLGILVDKAMDRRRHKVWIAIGLGFFCSLMIEAYQYVSLVGTFEVDDLIQNTWGAWIGCCLQNIVDEWYEKKKLSWENILPITLFIMIFGMCCVI